MRLILAGSVSIGLGVPNWAWEIYINGLIPGIIDVRLGFGERLVFALLWYKSLAYLDEGSNSDSW